MKKSTKSTAQAHGNGFGSETSNNVNSKGSKQDANLQKNSFVHFQIGLIVAMFLVYFGLEFAFSKVEPQVISQQIQESELFEFHPEKFVIEKNEVQKEVLQKISNSEDFVVVVDETTIPEHLEFKNEPVESSAPMSIDEVDFVEVPTDVVVPFVGLEDAPIFPGCEKVAKSDRQICFQEQMQKHIKKNFRYPEVAMETGTQGKVYVMFTIGKQGFIEDVKLKGPAKILEEEAARIIDKLPQMTPGKQHLKPVKVSFSIPINFQLQ